MIPLFGSVLANTYLIRFVSKKSKEKSKSSGNDSEHDKESNETNYDDEDQLEGRAGSGNYRNSNCSTANRLLNLIGL